MDIALEHALQRDYPALYSVNQRDPLAICQHQGLTTPCHEFHPNLLNDSKNFQNIVLVMGG